MTAKLLTTTKFHLQMDPHGIFSPAPITFTVGSSQLTLVSTISRMSICYLSVWINLIKSRSFVINQYRKEISSYCNILRNKRITNKQLLYIYNMVIIPRLEYLT